MTKNRRIARRLDAIRKSKGMTRKGFADYLGVESHSTVGDWCNARRIPKGDNLRTIGEKTGVSVDWILFPKEGESDDEPVYRGQAMPAADFRQEFARTLLRLAQATDFQPADVDVDALLAHAASLIRGEAGEWGRHLGQHSSDSVLKFAYQAAADAFEIEQLAAKRTGRRDSKMRELAGRIADRAETMQVVIPMSYNVPFAGTGRAKYLAAGPETVRRLSKPYASASRRST